MLLDDPSDDTLVAGYRGYLLKKIAIVAGGAAALIVLLGLSVTVGYRDIGFLEVYSVLFDHIRGSGYVYHSDEWWDDWIVCNVRLPRVAVGILAGAGLTISGAAMQSVMKNPLADPYTTGISSAAVFGVSISMVLGISFGDLTGQSALVLNAFVFGMIPAATMMLISRISTVSPATMILAGVAISSFFSALDTIVMTLATPEDMKSAFIWQVGSLDGIQWSDLPIMAAVVIVGSAAIGLLSNKMNILSTGDESATSLGVNVTLYRLVILALLSLVTASVISFTGIIGFVGLVVPHICRTFLGSDNRFILPACAFIGPIFVIGADVISRIISPQGDIPMGIVMSFIGGPLFLILIIRQRKGVW